MKTTTLKPGDVVITDGQFLRITAGETTTAQAASYEGTASFAEVDHQAALDAFAAGRRVYDADGTDGLEPGLWTKRRVRGH